MDPSEKLGLGRAQRLFSPVAWRPWIPVKIPVELSSADWLAGRDPVLEAVLAVLDG